MVPRIQQLLEHGQSLWLDYIDRGLLVDGTLRRMVELGVRGVTSNPTIFHKAITGGRHYDGAMRDLLQADHGMEPARLYEWLTVQDVQMTADVLAPVYESSEGADGYVSLEVSPLLADDAGATVQQARHLWKSVHRPNLMIKVPATRAGLAAIETLTAEGININVTLLFAVKRYEEVVDAFLRGLAQNGAPERIASVVSFFVSRIDSKIDARLAEIGTPDALALRGRIAVASAKSAYQSLRRRIDAGAFARARVQRLLWGSTSTKNPDYPALIYVENLIGSHTVNTVPLETLDAFLADGRAKTTITTDLDAARRDLAALSALGIDLAAVADELEREGVAKFAHSYDALLDALDRKRQGVMREYAGGRSKPGADKRA